MPRPVDLPTPSAHPSLEVSHRDCGDAVCVVTPAGEIDLATAPLLKSSLVGLLGDSYTRFVVDLAEVGYLDCTGLGVLIAFGRRLTEDGVIALAQPPAPVSALPFAESTADELRCWIRILSREGEAGPALQRVGLTDAGVELPATGSGDASGPKHTRTR